MVNELMGTQGSTKFLFHNNAMFLEKFPIVPDHDVSRLIECPSVFPSRMKWPDHMLITAFGRAILLACIIFLRVEFFLATRTRFVWFAIEKGVMTCRRTKFPSSYKATLMIAWLDRIFTMQASHKRDYRGVSWLSQGVLAHG